MIEEKVHTIRPETKKYGKVGHGQIGKWSLDSPSRDLLKYGTQRYRNSIPINSFHCDVNVILGRFIKR